ncbi:MAG: sigma-54 dependent transcriptional regulator [Thermoguttaceae bacterium]
MKDTQLAPLGGFQQVLLPIWQEASRHIEVSRFTAAVSKLLSNYLPISQLLVRRVDPSRPSVDTVAIGFSAPDYLLPETRSTCSAKNINEIVAWCSSVQVARRGAPGWADAPVEVLVPVDIRGDVLVGALPQANEPGGVLVLVAAEGTAFNREHADIVVQLLEPFCRALENDHRVREVAAMRAAAEAEKHTLLSRLGCKRVDEETVIGVDSGLSAVMERVDLVARSDAPVLLLGETGSGKEVIARTIHNRSTRTSGPFLRVNCGAIPPELIDSQLFGHERGAFTGAVETRQGWFERADGGTLLLDEVGELPLAAQVRLLRILQDGWLEKVGGQKPMHVDVRIIAATHRDLATMVSEGKFREDLWYRIAVFPILIPPLRERVNDIPELARHFAEQAASRFALPETLPTPDDIELLTAYAWPGNIRELAAVVDRAAILGNGHRLEFAKALGVTAGMPSVSGDGNSQSPDQSSRKSHFPTLDEAMRRHIESALELTHGRIEGHRGVAQLLQINPHTLRARMRKLKIDWTQFRQEEELLW